MNDLLQNKILLHLFIDLLGNIIQLSKVKWNVKLLFENISISDIINAHRSNGKCTPKNENSGLFSINDNKLRYLGLWGNVLFCNTVLSVTANQKILQKLVWSTQTAAENTPDEEKKIIIKANYDHKTVRAKIFCASKFLIFF